MKNYLGIFCASLLFFLSVSSYGQYSDWYDTCRTSYLLVKTNLITPFGLDGRSSVELGLEKSLFRSFSFSVNGGYQIFYRKEEVDTAFIQPRGVKVNAEFRFLLWVSGWAFLFIEKDVSQKRTFVYQIFSNFF